MDSNTEYGNSPLKAFVEVAMRCKLAQETKQKLNQCTQGVGGSVAKSINFIGENIIPLDATVEWLPMGNDYANAICAAFKVPVELLGEENSHSHSYNLEKQRYELMLRML